MCGEGSCRGTGPVSGPPSGAVAPGTPEGWVGGCASPAFSQCGSSCKAGLLHLLTLPLEGLRLGGGAFPRPPDEFKEGVMFDLGKSWLAAQPPGCFLPIPPDAPGVRHGRGGGTPRCWQQPCEGGQEAVARAWSRVTQGTSWLRGGLPRPRLSLPEADPCLPRSKARRAAPGAVQGRRVVGGGSNRPPAGGGIFLCKSRVRQHGPVDPAFGFRLQVVPLPGRSSAPLCSPSNPKSTPKDS